MLRRVEREREKGTRRRCCETPHFNYSRLSHSAAVCSAVLRAGHTVHRSVILHLAKNLVISLLMRNLELRISILV